MLIKTEFYMSRATEEGLEFWIARELQQVLEYTEWRNFLNVIEKAKMACQTSGNRVLDHFVNVNRMIELGGTMPEELPTSDKSVKELEKDT